jgi:hypothetical protein
MGEVYRARDTRLGASPDGRGLATCAVIFKSDLWLLEGDPLPAAWWKLLLPRR